MSLDATLTTATAVEATSMSLLLDTSQSHFRVHPVAHNLPPYVLEGIGKIVSLWAYEEWLLTGIASCLMNIGRKESRRDLNGRAEDALQAIRYAYKLANEQEPELVITIADQVDRLAELRNSVGHGIWVNDQNTGKLSLQRVSGVWDMDGNVVAKKDTPESVDASPEWFDSGCARISECITDTEQFARDVEALIASRA